MTNYVRLDSAPPLDTQSHLCSTVVRGRYPYLIPLIGNYFVLFDEIVASQQAGSASTSKRKIAWLQESNKIQALGAVRDCAETVGCALLAWYGINPAYFAYIAGSCAAFSLAVIRPYLFWRNHRAITHLKNNAPNGEPPLDNQSQLCSTVLGGRFPYLIPLIGNYFTVADEIEASQQARSAPTLERKVAWLRESNKIQALSAVRDCVETVGCALLAWQGINPCYFAYIAGSCAAFSLAAIRPYLFWRNHRAITQLKNDLPSPPLARPEWLVLYN